MATTTFRNPIRVGDPDGVTGTLIAGISTDVAVAASGNSDATLVLPTGVVCVALIAVRAAAVTGSPTTINLTAGSAAGGTQYVSAVDVKAAGVTSLTLVDMPEGTVHIRLATSGGTTPSGTVTVVALYVPIAQTSV